MKLCLMTQNSCSAVVIKASFVLDYTVLSIL